MSASQAASAELLGWLNQLLKLNYTKVEQCGSGGAYCQIIDSIDGNFPMYRVNMNANNEYEYIANFKLLTLYFKERKIEKARFCLSCHNFEFLQWMKRYWEGNNGGNEYDAVARRGGALATDTLGSLVSAEQLKAAQDHAQKMEEERDAYYTKLREIEVLVQQEVELGDGGRGRELLNDIQKILDSI
ncbi:hypothetical protein CTheo_5625 [Ceratobasidium theobromae]|uniref:EB1 C-terminal domain-containing protein n=1 Tax=Ceratobasidium theobromae TaxID=1582974 RepID=A0A5N5QHJ4_9AGAM|nr:hypothetical protein CTheo_5625 [Ceratobasidium theobromae]